MPLQITSAVNFLSHNVGIGALNFTFMSFKISPDSYRKVVADAFKDGSVTIKVDDKLSPRANASYDSDRNTLNVRPTFDLNGAWAANNRACLIHESTHIYLDFLDLGTTLVAPSEGVAYVAESVYSLACGALSVDNKEIPGNGIRAKAAEIAEKILIRKRPVVSSEDAFQLCNMVSKDYKGKVPYTSNK